MKISRLINVGISVFLLLTPAGLWAGGAGAGDDPPCQVANPGKGALALKATAAIWFAKYGALSTGSDPTVDVILRVERSGKQNFYRTTFIGDISSDDDPTIACKIFGSTCGGGVTDFSKQIIADYFGGEAVNQMELVIIPTSFSETDYDSGIMDTDRHMRIVDVSFYAIDLRDGCN